ncbi:MAG TPA: nuclear transport factor 2 family protein [Puia sp.]|nr:nuclear transport factor 2 family protein [Puia sp.]
MKKIILYPAFSIFTFSAFSQIEQKDTLLIKQLIERYAESIDNADTVLGSKLFSHSQEVSFIQPRGHQHGWDEIRHQIYDFFRETFAKRQLNILNEHITLYGDVAWAEFYWVFNATFKKGNQLLQTKGRETQIWRKSDNEWRLVHVHYSNMPITQEGKGF